ncbi:MAG TPA: hypothetical protein VHP33_12620 [Polyangiaceae bacterium]|nr:hypothetical protein [Polyangiaceae bacterium]
MGRQWFGVFAILGACRGASLTALPTSDEETGGDAPSGVGTKAAPSQGEGGAPAEEAPPGDVAAGEPAGVVGAGGAEAIENGEGCGAERVTLAELHSGRVRDSVPVALGPLVASSQKFLVSEAKSGSCLWGAFAADPVRTGAGSGLFLVSYGAPRAEGVACAAGSDGLPDDLKPGDTLEVEGRFDSYVPSTCGGTAPAPQLRIDAACPARRGASSEPPEAALLEPALADRLAAGKDVELLRQWSGALVQLSGVAALQDPDDGDAVFPFGVIRLQQTALEVHSRLYYFDLSEAGPRDSGKAPRYGFPTAFQRLTGIVFLDYCTWVLAPRDRCADLAPAGEGCASQAARP